MENTPTQDENKLHHHLTEMETKITLLENVISEILTSVNTLADSTKEAFNELKSLKAVPAQNTLLQLQEQPIPEITNPEPLPVEAQEAKPEIATNTETQPDIEKEVQKEPEKTINEEAPNVEKTEE